jgi:hypothetical protein
MHERHGRKQFSYTALHDQPSSAIRNGSGNWVSVAWLQVVDRTHD